MTWVLIALDESVTSLQAGRTAVRLFGGSAEFFVVNVARAAVPWVSARYGVVEGLLPGWDDAVSGMDERELERLAQWVGVHDPCVLSETGDPADRICDAAERHDVDVIVVGGHDRGFLARLLEPSVSAAVVRRAERPVLVVRESMGVAQPESR